jgi:tRNA dimethylallyltransferase
LSSRQTDNDKNDKDGIGEKIQTNYLEEFAIVISIPQKGIQTMTTTKKPPLIVLTGPTAVGKTSLSVKLAKRIDGEIISADSMQVYRGMDIGTAKISREEMDGVAHYLLDEFDPAEEFHVVIFQQKCKEYMEDIYRRGKIPIIVGGTGFYIQSVLYDIDFTTEEGDAAYRKELMHRAETEGRETLHRKLALVDPVSAQTIHPNNVKRVIRALEYYKETGSPISAHNQQQRQKESPYNFLYYVLSLPRDILYDRINKRVDLMRRQGLVQEVERLQKQGCTRDMVSMQALGYKEILEALDGKYSMEDAFEKIKQETRHFAKRQFTWFRRERNVTWLEKDQFPSEEALLEHCIREIKQKL